MEGIEATAQVGAPEVSRESVTYYDDTALHSRGSPQECSAAHCRQPVDSSVSFRLCIKCRKYRREHRRKQYGTIKALNAEKKTKAARKLKEGIVGRSFKQSPSMLKTMPARAELNRSLHPIQRPTGHITAIHQSTPTPSFTPQEYLSGRFLPVSSRLHQKFDPRSLHTSNTLFLDELEKERRRRSKLKHFDEHGFLIPVNAEPGISLARVFQTNTILNDISSHSQDSQSFSVRNRFITQSTADNSKFRFNEAQLRVAKEFDSQYGSTPRHSPVTKHRKEAKANEGARIKPIKIPPRSVTLQEQNYRDITPLFFDVNKHSTSNEPEQDSDISDVIGWDSDLSDLTSLDEASEEDSKEEQRPQLKIRIPSQQWRAATDAPRCCSRCQVRLAPGHRKKQCPNCLRLFRDYRHMRKAGIQVPQGFLNLNLKDNEEEGKKLGRPLPKIKASPLSSVAPSYQSFTLMISTLRRRLDEFICAHAEYTLSRERENKLDDDTIAARFTFRGECSTVLRRRGSFKYWSKSAYRVQDKLRGMLNTDIVAQDQRRTPEGGVEHHLIGVLDVPIPFVTRISKSPVEAELSDGAKSKGAETEDEDTPVLEIPSDGDGGDSSGLVAQLNALEATKANTSTGAEINSAKDSGVGVLQTPKQDTVVISKTMHVTVDIAVQPDRSHRFLPGQRTVVSFQLEG